MIETEFERAKIDLFKAYEIPDELVGCFSYYAWQQGHYAGYNEVLCILQDLLSEFSPSIKK